MQKSLGRREVGAAEVPKVLEAFAKELPMGSAARASVDCSGEELRLGLGLAFEARPIAGAVKESAGFFMMVIGDD